MNSILRIGPHPIWITRFALHHLSTRARQRVLRARYTRVVATTRTPELRGMPVELAPAGTLPPGLLRGAEQVRREADSACEHVVDLLGSGPTSLGRDIDWHRDFKSGYRWPAVFYQDIQATRLDDDSDAKVPWELSRGHQLVALARASVLFEEDRFAAELETQIRSWIDGNPTGVGINWQNAMETALRAVSWVWAIGTLEGRRPLDPTLRPAIARSLASHGRHIEHNLEGTPWVRSNHYMADLLGLLVLGWALPDDPRARRWWRTAHNGFEREIAKQVYDDGVDFEASLPYHGLVLEMLLLAAWVARRAGDSFSEPFDRRLASMITASRSLRHPDGRVPQFGDSDSGRVLPATAARPATHDQLIWLGAAVLGAAQPLTGHPSPEVAWTLGVPAWRALADASVSAEPHRKRFPRAGYWVLSDDALHVVVRAGNVGQHGNGGHAHNDALSFELSLAECPWLSTAVPTSTPPIHPRETPFAALRHTTRCASMRRNSTRSTRHTCSGCAKLQPFAPIGQTNVMSW